METRPKVENFRLGAIDENQKPSDNSKPAESGTAFKSPAFGGYPEITAQINAPEVNSKTKAAETNYFTSETIPNETVVVSDTKPETLPPRNPFSAIIETINEAKDESAHKSDSTEALETSNIHD